MFKEHVGLGLPESLLVADPKSALQEMPEMSRRSGARSDSGAPGEARDHGRQGFDGANMCPVASARSVSCKGIGKRSRGNPGSGGFRT